MCSPVGYGRKKNKTKFQFGDYVMDIDDFKEI